MLTWNMCQVSAIITMQETVCTIQNRKDRGEVVDLYSVPSLFYLLSHSFHLAQKNLLIIQDASSIRFKFAS